MRTPSTIVRPGDTIDSDEWSIITNRRQLLAAVHAWLADTNPAFLHELENGTTDIPSSRLDSFPNAVDEILDHLKEQP